MGQLAYEGDLGPEIAYRFERFAPRHQALALRRPASCVTRLPLTHIENGDMDCRRIPRRADFRHPTA
jgi:hypothetical protein